MLSIHRSKEVKQDMGRFVTVALVATIALMGVGAGTPAEAISCVGAGDVTLLAPAGCTQGGLTFTDFSVAVAGFTQSLAREVRDTGVRVNAVAPAAVRTADNVASGGAEARYVELDDIVHAVLFLASDGARAITGHVLPVTNGDL